VSALKALIELDRVARVKKYKGVPAHAIPRRAFSDATANGLTQAILQWLKLNGCYATRVSSAGRYLEAEGKWIPGTVRKGTADIHAVINGKHASIEVKIGRDKMSEAQERTRREVEASGGLYFIAQDFDRFHAWWVRICKGITQTAELTTSSKNLIGEVKPIE
jgi:hypothetical protein